MSSEQFNFETPADLFGAAPDPQELAATLSQQDIFDKLADNADTQLGIRAQIAQLEGKLHQSKQEDSVLQEALRLARDKGLE